MYSLIEFLKETYSKYPNNIACKDNHGSCTYKELWEDANKIADNLQSIIGIDKVIPIFMSKSVSALKALWGIIISGNFYSVIDPLLPSFRINSMVKVLRCRWVIFDDERKLSKLSSDITGLKISDLMSDVMNDEENKITSYYNRAGNKPAYVMFTSGSSGIPKGVVVSHESVIDFINNFTNIFKIQSTDVIGNQAPWDFDVSVKDIFSAAKTGATLLIIPKKIFCFPNDLAEYLDNNHVTILIWAVTALCILSSNGVLDKIRIHNLKKIIFSGEVMPISQLKIWRKNYPDVIFVNAYGPTEITCNCTYFIMSKDYSLDENAPIPIGRAFPNKNVFLLDEKNNLISESDINCDGQIYVSGLCVALGYYNNKQETESGFIQNPLNAEYREIVYKTGDIAYYDKNGNLNYKGRVDSQIKFMGHRIELSEIDRIISQYNGISRCITIYENNQIISIYSGEKVDDKEIKKYIKKELPVYMIPSKFIYLRDFPMNEHGKADRKKIIERVALNDNK